MRKGFFSHSFANTLSFEEMKTYESDHFPDLDL